jgi:hypothetical protein
MRQALAALALAACASSGASSKTPPPAAASSSADEAAAIQAAMQAAGALREATDRAQRECDEMDRREISASEERFMGAQLALSVAGGHGFYLDAPPSEAAPLPPGEKNDLNRYVQRVGAVLARGSARPLLGWTFGIVDDPKPRLASAMGGFVLISTGALARLSNEAELAAALAHEMAHVAGPDRVAEYRQIRLSACRVALNGLYLVQAGSPAPGAADFGGNARFGKTMAKLATAGFDFDSDPDADADFVLWFLDRVTQQRQLMLAPPVEQENAADLVAADLLEKAGYDSAAVEAVSPKKKKKRGNAPPFPPGLKWPAAP